MGILILVSLFTIGLVLWIVGSHMSSTYDNTIPKWENRQLTIKEFSGKAIMLVGSIFFVSFIGYLVRFLLQ